MVTPRTYPQFRELLRTLERRETIRPDPDYDRFVAMREALNRSEGVSRGVPETGDLVPFRDLIRRLQEHVVAAQTHDRANAAAKAKRLLKRFMTAEQLEQYRAVGHFTVINGKKKYRIGDDLLVKVYDRDDYDLAPPREVWCVSLPGTPMADSLLAQLLLLRADPAKLRKMACIRRINYRDHARVRDMLRRAGYGEP